MFWYYRISIVSWDVTYDWHVYADVYVCYKMLQDVTRLRFVNFWHPHFSCNATPIAVMCFPGFSLRWSLWCWVVLGDWYQDDVDIEKHYSARRCQSQQKATLTKKHRLRHSWGALTWRLQMTIKWLKWLFKLNGSSWACSLVSLQVTQKGWLCNTFTEFSKDWIGFHIEEDGGKNGSVGCCLWSLSAFFIEAIPAPRGLQSIVKTVKGAYIYNASVL